MSRDYDYAHIPVLAKESIAALAIDPAGIYVDATAGGGGHSSLILARLGEKGLLIALDRDPQACAASKMRLEQVSSPAKWEVIQARFSALKDLLAARDIGKIDGFLADLGVSSAQLDQPDRGFSYHSDGPLDMRMDSKADLTAAKWLEDVTLTELKRVLSQYGEERYAGRIAQAIIRARERGEINTTAELSATITAAMPASSRREKKHPARRSFQAIRMAVNEELGELELLLQQLPEIMAAGGRIAIISFHSLEDRLVKDYFRRWEKPCRCPKDLPICACGQQSLGKVVKLKRDIAAEEEISKNIRSRSARLRVFERGYDDE